MDDCTSGYFISCEVGHELIRASVKTLRVCSLISSSFVPTKQKSLVASIIYITKTTVDFTTRKATKNQELESKAME